MSLTFGIAVYFVVWWIVLFAVLPFGVRTQAEVGEVVPGTPSSAPAKFAIWRVIAINTCVACVVYLIILAVIVYDPFGISLLENASPV